MEKKVSVGMAKAGRSAAEEFLPVEIGKHDYDWLLAPPGTPLFSSVDSADHQPPPSSQRSASNLRSSSLLKPSRLSAQVEAGRESEAYGYREEGEACYGRGIQRLWPHHVKQFTQHGRQAYGMMEESKRKASSN